MALLQQSFPQPSNVLTQTIGQEVELFVTMQLFVTFVMALLLVFFVPVAIVVT